MVPVVVTAPLNEAPVVVIWPQAPAPLDAPPAVLTTLLDIALMPLHVHCRLPVNMGFDPLLVAGPSALMVHAYAAAPAPVA